jgi:hypothetical protein
MNSPPVKCGGCGGNGVCSRCRGSGATGKDEIRDNAILLGPIICKRCGGNGICPGCRGCGWVAFTAKPADEEQ